MRLKSLRGSAKVGDIAGGIRSDGYASISVDGGLFLSHRLAFLYFDGMFPLNDVDHINGKRADNRWINLRKVTRLENTRNIKIRKNKTSGFVGVNFDRASNKWRGQIKVKRKNVYLGMFSDIDDAIKARKDAEIKYGFHKNHGRAE